MTLHHAYLIKGWLLDKDPPKEITEAVEAIIAAAHQSELTPKVSGPAVHPVLLPQFIIPDASTADLRQAEPPSSSSDPVSVSSTPDGHSLEPAKKKRKSRELTDEEKAAIGARLKAAREAKAAKAAGPAPHDDGRVEPSTPPPAKPYTPASAEKLIQDHDGYAGRRDPGQPLTDEDWPDIKARLAKSPDRRAIASDYDVDLDDLNIFIASCQRREARSSGEAGASPSGVASGAARQTW